MRTLTKLAVLFMMVAATVSCTKDEIITPKEVEVEIYNPIVVRVNGDAYTLRGSSFVEGRGQSDINSEAAAVWLGLPDTEADFDVLRDRAANLTIEVISYPDNLTRTQVRGIIKQAMYLTLLNHTDLPDDGTLSDVYGGLNPRYTVIFHGTAPKK